MFRCVKEAPCDLAAILAGGAMQAPVWLGVMQRQIIFREAVVGTSVVHLGTGET